MNFFRSFDAKATVAALLALVGGACAAVGYVRSERRKNRVAESQTEIQKREREALAAVRLDIGLAIERKKLEELNRDSLILKIDQLRREIITSRLQHDQTHEQYLELTIELAQAHQYQNEFVQQIKSLSFENRTLRKRLEQFEARREPPA